jgi:uncharacterized membrane protein
LITTGCILVFVFFARFFENKSLNASLQSIPDFLQTEIFLSVFLYLILFSIFTKYDQNDLRLPGAASNRRCFSR